MSRRATNKADRRTSYTKKAIRDAYIELLYEMEPSKITVTEVCRRADINRGTFYLHYEDLPRVMDELEDEVYDEIVAFIHQSLADENNRQNVSDHFFIRLFQNPKMQRVVFESYYTERLKDKVMNYAETLLAELCVETGQLAEAEASLFAAFAVHACLGACRKLSIGSEKDVVAKSTFVNQLLKALYAAAVDPYEINEAYKRRFVPKDSL